MIYEYFGKPQLNVFLRNSKEDSGIEELDKIIISFTSGKPLSFCPFPLLKITKRYSI